VTSDARGKCGEGMLTVGVLSNMATERLLKLGMRKVIVPFGVDDGEPHTVILVSADFDTNTQKVAVLVCLPTHEMMDGVLRRRFRLRMSLGCGPVVSWTRIPCMYSSHLMHWWY